MKKHGTKIVPAFRELLNDESPSVRRNGIFALGFLNDVAAEREIIPMLKAQVLSVRLDAAKNLTMLQVDEIRFALLQSLTDEAPQMRQQIVHRFGFHGENDSWYKKISNHALQRILVDWHGR